MLTVTDYYACIQVIYHKTDFDESAYLSASKILEVTAITLVNSCLLLTTLVMMFEFIIRSAIQGHHVYGHGHLDT